MKFRIRFGSTFFTLLGLALLIFLGTWQAQRYISKKAFEEARDAQIDLPILEHPSGSEIANGAVDFRRIRISGHWDRERGFLIKHRVYRGKPGFWVVSPLFISTQEDPEPLALLVNRGWVPFTEGEERAETLLLALPEGEVTLTGLIHVLEYVVPDRSLREALDSEAFTTGILAMDSYDTEAMNQALAAPGFERPLVLTIGESSTPTDTYPVASFDHITEPYLTSETHFGYALTWYVLALALIAIWVANGLGLLHAAAYSSPSGPIDRDDSLQSNS